MTRGKRLLGLVLAGAVLVSGALWARRQWDPNRFASFPVLQLEAWVAEHPVDADALYELGRRYRRQGQVTDARQALDLLDAVEELESQLDAKAGQSREALSEWAIKEANSKLSRAAKNLAAMREDSAAAGRSRRWTR